MEYFRQRRKGITLRSIDEACFILENIDGYTATEAVCQECKVVLLRELNTFLVPERAPFLSLLSKIASVIPLAKVLQAVRKRSENKGRTIRPNLHTTSISPHTRTSPSIMPTMTVDLERRLSEIRHPQMHQSAFGTGHNKWFY